MLNMFKLYFDGGSRGNPGPSGCGWYINDSLKGYNSLGIATNNQAEYRGMINGLKVALKYGIEDIEVYGDSKLVIEHMKGNWKVKSSNTIPLWKEAKTLSDKFRIISFSWIPRSKNTLADELANRGIDNND